ncbi:MAG: hypothetical protein JNK64_37750 [Myxococcales bacterium]|nr:hypothetical protein [Myxococcales bacterium]
MDAAVDGATDAGASDADGTDAGATDAGAPNLTVRIQRGPAAPVDGLWVAVSASTGQARSATQTSADGTAMVHVEPGDQLTALWFNGDAYYTTIAGVQPGDQIVIADAPPRPTVRGSIAVTLPPIAVGSGWVSVTSDCAGALVTSAPTSLDGCRTDDLIDVEALATSAPFPGPAQEVGFAVAQDVPFGASLTLGPWQTPRTAHLALAIAQPPAAGWDWIELQRTGSPRLPWRVLGDVGHAAPLPPTLDLAYDAAPAEATRLVVHDLVPGTGGTWTQRREATLPPMASPPPATVAVDVTAALPPRLGGPSITTPVPGRPRLTWSGNAAGTTGYVRLTLTSGGGGALLTTWTVYLPPGATEFRVPALPPPLTSPGLDGDRLMSSTIEVVDQSDLRWDDFRQQPRQRPAPVGPAASRTITSLEY